MPGDTEIPVAHQGSATERLTYADCENGLPGPVVRALMNAPSIVLFRRDLRVADNAALSAAQVAGPTIAVFVLDERADGRPLGGAACWWLHHALLRLRQQLNELGVPLILRKGDQNNEVIDIAVTEQAGGVYWNRRYTPWGIAQDTVLESKLQASGRQCH